MKIISVVGARPNFMKIAPLVRAITRHNATTAADAAIEHVLVHTGQHYDERMSATFFDALDIPHPDLDLGIGSGTHAEQVGRTMIEFEKVVRSQAPDWVVVVGDVNATCACAITAKKEQLKLAHVEAGLRSFDPTMPEEINRMVTDRLADLLFTTDRIASENLHREGVPEDRIKLVGNIMIDTFFQHRARAEALDLDTILRTNAVAVADAAAAAGAAAVEKEQYAVLTLHRPANVDVDAVLTRLVVFLTTEVAPVLPLLWPVHPRTEKRLRQTGLWDTVSRCPGLRLLNPVGYHEMLKLNLHARLMFTDSGGLQEECCVLGTPCITLRPNTERPVTLETHGGVSILTGNEIEPTRRAFQRLKDQSRRPHQPPLWDGHTAERIVAILAAQE